MASEQTGDVLVIGYGNELRSDDGAGPAVARSIEALGLPGLRVRACHQLTPELAEDISVARAVIFIDAREVSKGSRVETTEVQPAMHGVISAHRSDPAALAGLAQSLFGHCPPAWMVTVPAVEFDFGERFSPLAQQGVAEAVLKVQQLCDSLCHA
jgi:hydrogenase maturation protease